MGWFRSKQKLNLSAVCEAFINDCCRHADGAMPTFTEQCARICRDLGKGSKFASDPCLVGLSNLWLRSATIAFEARAIGNVVSASHAPLVFSALEDALNRMVDPAEGTATRCFTEPSATRCSEG